MTILNIAAPQKTQSFAKLPDFIERRVVDFYETRVKKTWSGRHITQGKTPEKTAVIVCHNDYLNLAQHPSVIEAQRSAMSSYGNGVMMSAIFQHGLTPQRAFEMRLAAHMQAPDGVLAQSGWCANVGLVQAIADAQTPVYIDMLAHMSLWEGIRSAGAKAHPFYHNDMDHLHKQILRHGPGVVLVDSVYSSNGSVCPLAELVAICEPLGCAIVVDESHSLGTHGVRGEGMVASLGLQSKVHFVTASLAKAFAGRGGYIACSEEFRSYFGFEALPAIFSSSVLPAEIAGFNAVLDRIEADQWRRKRLQQVSDRLRVSLDALGYNVDDSESQIISLEAGPEPDTMRLRDAMEARDIVGAIFCAPATPKNRSLLRLSLHCGLSDDDVSRIITAAAAIRDEVRLKEWPSTRRKLRRADSVSSRAA
jgi:CAI-1 autoinducer synthase